MKRLLKIFTLLIVLGLAYLVFWPVPLSPVSWDAPKNQGYVGDFAPNQKLANLERLSIGEIHGPEDVVGLRGKLYVSSQEGKIMEIDPQTGDHRVFAETTGVPLGMEADAVGNLIVADAYRGLLSIGPEGSVTVLTDTLDGTPILYADDLDIDKNGVIYFSDASTKYGAEAAGSTMSGSLLEIMEHGRTGRILAYDPSDSSTRLVMDDLSFANGVAMAPDGETVMVAETGEYRVHAISPDGTNSVIIDNLPGFPDNINRGPDGTLLVGLISMRSDFLDDMSAKPFWRKLAWRLPEFMKPKAVNYGHIVQIDTDGNVLKTWQDPSGAYPQTTGGVVIDDYLYVSSLSAKDLGRRPYP